MVKIKDMPVNDRPIEKMLEHGIETLTNEELIAILIRTGSKKQSSKEIASVLLSEIKGIENLKNISLRTLKKIEGIGTVKASIILAALELSKRVDSVQTTLYNEKITDSSIVFEYFKTIFKNKFQECFYAIYLDNNKRVIETKLLFVGTLDRSMVHPRELFKEAYIVGASSIICIHNHPSGLVEPSKMDLIITKELKNVGELLGIRIDDHIIIGKDKYYSFFENDCI